VEYYSQLDNGSLYKMYKNNASGQTMLIKNGKQGVIVDSTGETIAEG